jgi:drug/metabolite transporter (DMT)-like permease
MTDRQIKGLKWAMATALISGVAVFANSLVVKEIDPLVHTTVKNGLVGLMILILMLVTSQWKSFQGLSRNSWVKLMTIAVVGGSVSFALFFTGLKMIGGPQGAMIHKTLVVWVVLLAVPLLGEKMSWKASLGLLLLYLSNFAAGFNGFSELQLGHALVLMATVLWAVENVVAKVTLMEVSPNVVVTARMGFGSLILIGILVASGKAPMVAQLTGMQWLMLSGVALLLFGYVMSWYRALKLAPATLVAGVLVGATVFTNLLNGLFTDKAFTLAQLGQAVFIVTGIWLVVMAAYDTAGVGGKSLEAKSLD